MSALMLDVRYWLGDAAEGVSGNSECWDYVVASNKTEYVSGGSVNCEARRKLVT